MCQSLLRREQLLRHNTKVGANGLIILSPIAGATERIKKKQPIKGEGKKRRDETVGMFRKERGGDATATRKKKSILWKIERLSNTRSQRNHSREKKTRRGDVNKLKGLPGNFSIGVLHGPLRDFEFFGGEGGGKTLRSSALGGKAGKRRASAAKIWEE